MKLKKDPDELGLQVFQWVIAGTIIFVGACMIVPTFWH
jgi:hypothetical protein